MNLYQYYTQPNELMHRDISEQDGGLYIGSLQHGIVICSVRTTTDWNGAIEFCMELNHNGYNDWTLPSREQLKYILLRTADINKYEKYKIDPRDYFWTNLERDYEFAYYEPGNGYEYKEVRNEVIPIRTL